LRNARKRPPAKRWNGTPGLANTARNAAKRSHLPNRGYRPLSLCHQRALLRGQDPQDPHLSPSPALAGGADLLPKLRFKPRLRSFWIVAAAFVVSAAVVYHVARANFAIGNAPGGIVAVCPIPIAQQLAADLVRGYAAKSAISADRFVLTDSAPCDVRFSTTPDTPEDVIARDGIVAVVNPLNMISRISEKELREIFSGTIRNWSQVGMAPGAIVPILPDAASDEARALKSSLFFGVAIAHGVRRSGSSADVARGVAGTDRASRNAIGLVAFSPSPRKLFLWQTSRRPACCRSRRTAIPTRSQSRCTRRLSPALTQRPALSVSQGRVTARRSSSRTDLSRARDCNVHASTRMSCGSAADQRSSRSSTVPATCN
jgi:hypothetical protein